MVRYEQIDKRTYTVYVNAGFGGSPGNMIDAICGREPDQEPWVKVTKKRHGWHLIDENMTDKHDATDLSFSRWDDEVTSLDTSSDESQCFKMSNRLQYRGRSYTPRTFGADSIDDLVEAFSHMQFCAFCPSDI